MKIAGPPESNNGPDRRAFLRGGLLAGFGLAAIGVGSTAFAGRARASTGNASASAISDAATYSTQNEWAWCYKCQGLFYGPHQASSWCPDGSTHSAAAGNVDYYLGYDVNAAVGPPW